MKIIAKSNLSLNREKNSVVIYYDTYDRSTFDQYLMASLAKNAENKDEAYAYIDDITGKGSLNQHFRNLYDRILKLDEDQIKKILSDSLYPVTRIVSEFYYYYPQLDISLYHKKSYEGDLRNKKEIFVSAILPKEANGQYRDLVIEKGGEKVSSETHDIVFDDNGIYVDFGDKNPHFISSSLEKEINPNHLDEALFSSKNISLSPIDEKSRDYRLLDDAIFSALLKEGENRFLNKANESIRIDQDCFAKLEVIKVFDTYFYREVRLEFSKGNRETCDEALTYLMGNSNQINTMKTRTLISIMEKATDLVAQKTVNYVLARKNSKEIAEVGLRLIDGGLYKGWEKETLISIRRSLGSTAITSVYRCDPELGYSIEDLVAITDRTILLEKDREKLEKYLEDRDNKIKQINAWIGEMTTSAVREKMKSLKNKDNIHEQLKKFLNDRVGHVSKNIKSLSDRDLDNLYKEIKSMFEGPYQNIKSRVEKDEQ